MTETIIKPEEFKTMPITTYKRLLMKDFAKLSRKSGLKDYIYVYQYKFGGKKQDLLLFVDPKDKEWTAEIERIKTVGLKFASGECKVLEVPDRDGDGNDDITIAIKNAVGDLSKAKVVEYLNTSMFDNNPALEAVELNDLSGGREESNEEILAKKTLKGSGNKTVVNISKEQFQKDTQMSDEKLEEDEELTELLKAINGFFKKSTGQAILDDYIQKCKDIKTLASKPGEDENYYQSVVVPAAKKLDEDMDNAVIILQDIVDKGKDWLAGTGNQFHIFDRGLHQQRFDLITTQVANSEKMSILIAKMNASLEGFIHFDESSYQALKKSMSELESLPEAHLDVREAKIYDTLDILSSFQRSTKGKDEEVSRERLAESKEISKQLLSSLSAINKKQQKRNDQFDEILKSYEKYTKKYDPYRTKSDEEVQSQKGKSLKTLLDQRKSDLMAIYSSCANWKLAYPAIEADTDRDRFNQINRLMYEMDAENAALDEELDAANAFDEYNSADEGGKLSKLQDKEFMGKVYRKLPLSEYVNNFYKEAGELLPDTDFLKIIAPLVVTSPNPELDLYYYCKKNDALVKKVYDLSVSSTVPTSTQSLTFNIDMALTKKGTSIVSGNVMLQEDTTGNIKTEYWSVGIPSDVPYEDLYVEEPTDLGGLFDSAETYVAKDEPLYGTDGRPKYTHVQQGDIGDCWLMASLSSIAHNSPTHIENMLHDDGKGYVYVRLFKVVRTPVKKSVRGKEVEVVERTFKPKILKIKKSVPKISYNPDNGVWVKMIEKAYVAGGFSGSYDNNVTKKKASNLSGGWAEYAFEVLMGKPTTYDKTVQARYGNDVGNSENAVIKGFDVSGPIVGVLPWAKSELNTYNNTWISSYEGLVAYDIFGGDNSKIKAWFQFVQKGSISRLFARENSTEYSGAVTIEDLEKLFGGSMTEANGTENNSLPVLETSLKTAMLKWLREQKLFPGKLGTGTYSKLQESTYELVRKALKDDNKIVAMTAKVAIAPSGTVTGSGASGGEGKAFGLAGSHVYSGLDCKRGSDDLLYIKVRNPWGSFSREYIKASDALEKLNTKIAGQIAKTKEQVAVMDEVQLNAAVLLAGKNNDNNVSKWVKERNIISKSAATDLVPMERDDVGEGGESWIELSDFTKRFYSVEIA